MYAIFLTCSYLIIFSIIGVFAYLIITYTKLGQRLTHVDQDLLELEKLVANDPNYGDEPIFIKVRQIKKGGTDEKRNIV